MTYRMTSTASFETIQVVMAKRGRASMASVEVDDASRTVEVTDDPLSGETAEELAEDLRAAGLLEA
jgi:hypothetical protein